MTRVTPFLNNINDMFAAMGDYVTIQEKSPGLVPKGGLQQDGIATEAQERRIEEHHSCQGRLRGHSAEHQQQRHEQYNAAQSQL